ncbi:MAG: hypothetical protein BGP16_00930 [Sphingobium sp. 66-54]|mgnify:CR=1 FL=1|nr:MAG: hypothetical protein BGP16_00930 [Sphingobium sp. 66-54]
MNGDDKDIKKHWNAQEPSLFREPGKHDPGFSIVNNTGQAKDILASEMDGNPVQLYKTRNPATTYEDPIAKAQSLIRWHHSHQPSDDEFRTRVKSVEDQLLFLLLRGDMSDNQRANGLVKLAKLLADAQKRQEDLLHRDKVEERKRTEQMLKASRMAEQMRRQRRGDGDA